jgi:hypothetical protein
MTDNKTFYVQLIGENKILDCKTHFVDDCESNDRGNRSREREDMSEPIAILWFPGTASAEAFTRSKVSYR